MAAKGESGPALLLLIALLFCAGLCVQGAPHSCWRDCLLPTENTKCWIKCECGHLETFEGKLLAQYEARARADGGHICLFSLSSQVCDIKHTAASGGNTWIWACAFPNCPTTLAPSQTSTFGNRTTPDQQEPSDGNSRNRHTLLFIIPICAALALVLVSVKWKSIKCGVGSERCMKYCKCNGRVEKEAGTSSSNSINPTVTSRQDEGSELLPSKNPADTAIAVPNGDTEHSNGTGTDPA